MAKWWFLLLGAGAVNAVPAYHDMHHRPESARPSNSSTTSTESMSSLNTTASAKSTLSLSSSLANGLPSFTPALESTRATPEHPHTRPAFNLQTSTVTVTVTVPSSADIAPFVGASSVTTTASPYELAETTSPSSTYEFPYSRLGPIATLTPTIADDHDLTDVQHLTPQNPGSGSALHYVQGSTGSNSPTLFAIATPNYKTPSVVLDHSSLVEVVAPNAQSLVISFTDANAFSHSQANWNAGQGLLFVTFTEGCGDYESGQRCYFTASGLTFNSQSLTVTVSGQSVPLEEAIHNVNVVWGSYASSSVSAGHAASTVSTITTKGTSQTPSTTGSGSAASATSSGSSPNSQVSASNTSSASNGTTTTTSLFAASSTASCYAPVDTVYGLPTACLGPAFDQELDDALGYANASSFSFDDLLDALTPVDSEDYDIDDEEDDSEDDEDDDDTFIVDDEYSSDGNAVLSDTDNSTVADGDGDFGSDTDVYKRNQLVRRRLRRGALRRRGAVATIKAKVQTLAKAVTSKAGTIIKTVAKVAYNIITGKPNTFDSGVLSFQLPRNSSACNASKSNCKPIDSTVKLVDSPWGSAILLKSFGSEPSKTSKVSQYVNLYCVKCGITGGTQIQGNITIDGLNGITAGTAGASVDLTIGVGVGIDAQAIYTNSFKNNLYDLPLSPFTLGFITVGPILSIGAELNFTANATGRALARAEFSIARANWTYDFVKGSATSVGFRPQFRPSLEADGSLSVSTGFGLPVGLELGITTFNGCTKCKGSVGLVDKPSLTVTASIAVSGKLTTAGASGSIVPVDNCTGISTQLSFNNVLSAAFKGFGLVEKEWKIHELGDTPLKGWCIPIGSKSSKTRRDTIPLLYGRQDNTTIVSNSSDVSSTNSTNSTLLDLTSYVVSNLTDVGYAGPDIPPVSYNLNDSYIEDYDFTAVVVQGSNATYGLTACSDNNLYIQSFPVSEVDDGTFAQCDSLWQRYDDVVLSTPTGGVLHYYNNTMAKTGVSRLRTADEASLPESAVYVVLIPDDTDADEGDSDDDGGDSTGMFIAMDPNENIFYLAICTYNATDAAVSSNGTDITNSTTATSTVQSPKIFLIEDPVVGLQTLASPDVEYSITGGPVNECYLLALDDGSDVEGQWLSDYAGDVPDDADYYLSLNSTAVDA